MKVSLDKFKKVSENSSRAILQHPDGHKIMIAKGILSKDHLKELSKLPMHLAEGGEAAPEEEEEAGASMPAQSQPQQQQQPTIVINNTPPQAPQPSFMSQAGHGLGNLLGQAVTESIPGYNMAKTLSQIPGIRQGVSDFTGGLSQGTAGQPVEAASVPQAPTGAQTPATFPAPTATTPQASDQNETAVNPDAYQQYQNSMQEAYNNQIHGIQGSAAAQGQIGQQQAEALGNTESALADINQRISENVDKYQAESDNLMKDYQNQHIDPNHFVNNMSTFSSIKNAIGLILGGFGSGLTHTPNAALGVIQQQIQNDVQAQYAELGKKKSLLDYNMQQFHNTNDALRMTQANLLDLTKVELEKAAAQNQGTLAAANAQAAIGPLQQQSAKLKLEVANNQAFFQGLQQQTNPSQPGSSQIPNTAGNILGLQKLGYISPEQGTSAMKEVGIVDKTNQAVLAANQLGNEMSKIQTLGSRIGSPIESHLAIQRAVANLTPLVIASSPSKRLNEETAKLEIMPYVQSVWEGKVSAAQATQALQQHILNAADPTPNLDSLKTYGINPRREGVLHVGAPVKQNGR